MSAMAQLQIAYELWKDWLRETFGSGIAFPTEHLAPGYVGGYSK
jgi:hypothetical protein